MGRSKLRAAKCPVGDDPLTVGGSDPETSEGDGRRVPYSFHLQQAEKQRLFIDSSTYRASGTFTLSLKDTFGDEWETDPIPNKVRHQPATGTSGSEPNEFV